MSSQIERGSGNVFADIGIPDPETYKLKVQLSILIEDAIRDRGLSQRQAASVMGVSQSDVSNIVRGVLASYSLERLIRCLRAVGIEVSLSATPQPPDAAQAAALAAPA